MEIDETTINTETSEPESTDNDEMKNIEVWVKEQISNEIFIDSLAEGIIQEERFQILRRNVNKEVNALKQEITATQKWLRVILLTQRAILEQLASAKLCDLGSINVRAEELTNLLIHPQFAKGLGIRLDRRNPVAVKKEEKIDCQSRIHICKAACCRLRFALDQSTVASGRIEYDKDNPFLNKRIDGVCMYLKDGKCTIYELRPITCQTYSCRNDKRIWADFEKKVPSEHLKKRFTKEEV